MQVTVVPYDPKWPETYHHEAERLKAALDENCFEVHHVGSTSVPGLPAKPKIDIIAVVASPSIAIEQLAPLGYEYRGEYNIPSHYGFSKRVEGRFNLHVYEKDHPEIELNLTFRNYLRDHLEARDAYAELKTTLLKNPLSHQKKDSAFTGYTLGKNAFITQILNKAHFKRLRMTICTHEEEWEYLKNQIDPSDAMYLILYAGTQMIGYAAVDKEKKKLLFIEVTREKGLFKSWIENWLTKVG